MPSTGTGAAHMAPVKRLIILACSLFSAMWTTQQASSPRIRNGVACVTTKDACPRRREMFSVHHFYGDAEALVIAVVMFVAEGVSLKYRVHAGFAGQP
jgi:hypothetical protein